MAKSDISKELRALGAELSGAFKQIRSSREFKDLEKELKVAVKGVSSSVVKGLRAAKSSKEAAIIKKRLKIVVKGGSAQGKQEAIKARKAAADGLRRMRAVVRNLRHRAKKQNG